MRNVFNDRCEGAVVHLAGRTGKNLVKSLQKGGGDELFKTSQFVRCVVPK